MSGRGRLVERWVIIGVAVLMVVIMALLARMITIGNQREGDLAQSMLDRALANQSQRVRVLTNMYAWDLEEEAGRLRQTDRITDQLLLDRWLPVISNRHAIRAIGLADDQGNAWMLARKGSRWQFTDTRQEDGKARSMVRAWEVNGGVIPAPDTLEAQPDPREASWFSRALENNRSGPVWSEDIGRQGPGDLALSVLVNNHADGEVLCILYYLVDAGVMLTYDAERQPEAPGVILNSRWELISPRDTGLAGRLWDQAIREHRSALSMAPYRFEYGNKRWLGRVVPLYLNGTKLQSGMLVGFEGLEHWGNQRRAALWSVLALLVLLSLLLTVVFIQGRSADLKAQRQARRSTLQARHLAQAIEQREILDREVHHRVKNNLQVVSSLLNLQAQRVPDEGARKEFMRGKRRIDSMALVHHKLYRQTDLAAVDLGVFLNDIATAMAAMFEPESRSVSHSVESHGICCDADTSIQLGMLLCELLANSHQHAFPYQTGGHIYISVNQSNEGAYRLVVKDNGKGFDPDQVKEFHLGLEVVEALAEQLDGSMHVASGNGGTSVEVDFRAGERL